MLKDCSKCTVGDLVSRGEAALKTGPFGTQLHASDYVDSGTPVINVRNIGFGNIRPENLEYISDDTVSRLSGHLLEPKDIVFGRKGAVERHAFIRECNRNWFQGSDCLRLRFLTPTIDAQFVSYLFLTAFHAQWMSNQCSHGATMASLNQDIICRIPLLLPSLSTQHKITAILSAYDDLIENNTRRIKILEEMAQTIYREWFVNFRFPGHEKVKMIESEMGMIPEGWEVKTVPEAIHINPTTKAAKDSIKPFVTMQYLSNNSMLINGFECRTGNSGSKFINGDTLFARITPCLENGKTGFVQFLTPEHPVAIGSTEFIVLRSKTLCPEFVYMLARSDSFRDNAIKSMTGASGRQRVKEGCFDNYIFPHPPVYIIECFRKYAEPLFRQVQLLSMKSQNLRQSRDMLLPKLISGEVDVSNLNVRMDE